MRPLKKGDRVRVLAEGQSRSGQTGTVAGQWRGERWWWIHVTFRDSGVEYDYARSELRALPRPQKERKR